MGVEELVVTINNEPVFRFMGPRVLLLTRAQELAAAGNGQQKFFLNGAELLMEGGAEPPPQTPPSPEPTVIDADIIEVAETPAAAEVDEPATSTGETLSFRDAASLSKDLLTKTVNLHERMLDRAAERSMRMLEGVSKQSERALKNAVDTQSFVGHMNARLAEERLAAFKIRTAEEERERREAMRVYQRERAIAEANKPSPAMMVTELATSFLCHFAANAAQNFAVMNAAPHTIVEGDHNNG